MPIKIEKKAPEPTVEIPKVEAPKADFSEVQAKASLLQVEQLREVSTLLEKMLNKPGEARPKKLIATVTHWVKVDGQNRIKTLEIKLE